MSREINERQGCVKKDEIDSTSMVTEDIRRIDGGADAWGASNKGRKRGEGR